MSCGCDGGDALDASKPSGFTLLLFLLQVLMSCECDGGDDLDASKLVLSGPGLVSACICESAQFIIDGTRAGCGKSCSKTIQTFLFIYSNSDVLTEKFPFIN